MRSGADAIFQESIPQWSAARALYENGDFAEAAAGFAAPHEAYKLKVLFPERWLSLIPESLRQGLCSVLEQDPRPAYVQDSERVFGIPFAGFDVRFIVAKGVLTVVEIVCIKA